MTDHQVPRTNFTFDANSGSVEFALFFEKSVRWSGSKGLGSSLGIRASPASAAGLPHNSDMVPLYSRSELRPVRSDTPNQRAGIHTLRLFLLSTGISTGTSNVSSPYLLRAISEYGTPPIRTVTACRVSGLSLCSRSRTPEVAMETLICSRSSSGY